MLEGRELFILTNHKLSATPSADSLLPGRPANSSTWPMSPTYIIKILWATSAWLFLEFMQDIQHLPGKDNVAAMPNHAGPSFPAWHLQTFGH